MTTHHAIEARAGARWGSGAVLAHTADDVLRVPLPESLENAIVEGQRIVVYRNPSGGLDGWALPEEQIGVRMDADQDRTGSRPARLDCKGECRTAWYLVSGGHVPASDGCLTCGGTVLAA